MCVIKGRRENLRLIDQLLRGSRTVGRPEQYVCVNGQAPVLASRRGYLGNPRIGLVEINKVRDDFYVFPFISISSLCLELHIANSRTNVRGRVLEHGSSMEETMLKQSLATASVGRKCYGHKEIGRSTSLPPSHRCRQISGRHNNSWIW